MNITILPYEPADLYSVMTVWNSIIAEGDAFLEETPLSPEEMGTFLDQFRGVFCAKIGNEVGGIYMLHKLNPGKGSHIAEVIYAVKFSFRTLWRRQKMCEHSVNTARSLGFAAFVCNRIPALSPATMNFLTKSGSFPPVKFPAGTGVSKLSRLIPNRFPLRIRRKESSEKFSTKNLSHKPRLRKQLLSTSRFTPTSKKSDVHAILSPR